LQEILPKDGIGYIIFHNIFFSNAMVHNLQKAQNSQALALIAGYSAPTRPISPP